MSSFFDPPPPPPKPPGRPWAGRRDAVIGRTVALNLLIGRSEKAAVWSPALTADADGFEFNVELRHDLDEDELTCAFFDPYSPRPWRPDPEGLDPGLLRFGLQFSDGRRATNLDHHIPPRRPGEEAAPPERVALSAQSGGGGGGNWRQEFRVSPLPPAGPLAFVCEWPAAGIPETRSEIDSALIRTAAADAQPLWPGTGRGEDSGDSISEWHRIELPSPDDPPEPDDPAA